MNSEHATTFLKMAPCIHRSGTVAQLQQLRLGEAKSTGSDTQRQVPVPALAATRSAVLASSFTPKPQLLHCKQGSQYLLHRSLYLFVSPLEN